MQYAIKVIISSIIIVIVSEIGKRNSHFAALLASLPLTSILAIIWLYSDTKDISRIVELSQYIFWFVFPSLAFFLVFPFLLNKGMGFVISLSISILATSAIYLAFSRFLKI